MVELGLSNNILKALSSTSQVESLLKSKDDVNQLIGFLGNLCSLCKSDFGGLSTNIQTFIVSKKQHNCLSLKQFFYFLSLK